MGLGLFGCDISALGEARAASISVPRSIEAVRAEPGDDFRLPGDAAQTVYLSRVGPIEIDLSPHKVASKPEKGKEKSVGPRCILLL